MNSKGGNRSKLLSETHPLEAICLFALFFAGILFGISVTKVYSIPYGIDFGEGYLANASLEIIQGQNPYHSLDAPPWIVTSYPPLYPFINGLFMILTGPTLIAGRFISTVSLIGILVVSIMILRKANIGSSVSLIAAGILLVFPWPVNWAQVVRVDILGIFLTITGIFFWIRSEKKIDVYLAAIFLSLAAFTKQSLLVAPVSLFVYALLTKNRNAMSIVGMTLLLSALLYCFAGLASGGGIFLHLFHYTTNAYFFERLTAGLGNYFKSTWLIHLMAASSFVIPGTLTGSRVFFAWYYLFAHLAIITYGFEGSDTNYFIEPLLSTVFLTAFLLDYLVKRTENTRDFFGAIPSPRTIGFALMFLIIFMGRFLQTDQYRIQRTTPERIQQGLELVRLAHAVSGDILSEDASFTLLAGKRVLFQPYIMTLLSRVGKWNQQPFVDSIKSEQYSMIILRVNLHDPANTEVRGGAWEAAGFDRWTPEMEQAIKDHYTLHGGLDVGVGNLWYVYIANSQLN